MRAPFHFAGAGILSSLPAAVLFGCLLLAGVVTVTAGQLTADEYGVKAAFLYNLAKFVDWPPVKFQQDDSAMVIGVAGEEALERIRAVVGNKSIDKHKISIRLIVNAEEVKLCHILFVGRSYTRYEIDLVESANKAAVLTVGEKDDFLEAGGMIRFYLDSDNLRLEINDQSVRHAGLTIKATALSTLLSKGIAKLRKA